MTRYNGEMPRVFAQVYNPLEQLPDPEEIPEYLDWGWNLDHKMVYEFLDRYPDSTFHLLVRESMVEIK